MNFENWEFRFEIWNSKFENFEDLNLEIGNLKI